MPITQHVVQEYLDQLEHKCNDPESRYALSMARTCVAYIDHDMMNNTAMVKELRTRLDIVEAREDNRMPKRIHRWCVRHDVLRHFLIPLGCILGIPGSVLIAILYFRDHI